MVYTLPPCSMQELTHSLPPRYSLNVVLPKSRSSEVEFHIILNKLRWLQLLFYHFLTRCLQVTVQLVSLGLSRFRIMELGSSPSITSPSSNPARLCPYFHFGSCDSSELPDYLASSRPVFINTSALLPSWLFLLFSSFVGQWSCPSDVSAASLHCLFLHLYLLSLLLTQEW